jgi:membrane-associated protein
VSIVSSVVDEVLSLNGTPAYLLVGGLAFAEAAMFVGFVLPGETAVILGGVLANQHKVSLSAMIVVAVVAAIIGDSIGYEVGRRWGRRLTARIPHRVLRPERVRQAEESVRRLGGRAVFVGRFTTTLRILVPGFAGMSRVPYREFVVWNAAGGVIWATSFVVLGLVAGSQYQRAAHNATLVGLALVVVVGAVLTVVWLRRRRR